jgi:NAD-dependent deacetylase
LKPDFIFFGEGIPQDAYMNSFAEADKADVFLLIGTTGLVQPAAYIPYKAKQNGAKIIEVNPERTAYTEEITDIFLKGKAGEVMTKLIEFVFETN